MIKRDRYLDRLKSLTGSRTIKIVTGIRRCGKSYLLFRIFKEYLLSVGINNDHILTYQLDDIDNIHLRDVSTLYYDIKNKVVDSDTYYILIDEIQLVDRFHEILNSLLHIDNCDVFVNSCYVRLLVFLCYILHLSCDYFNKNKRRGRGAWRRAWGLWGI